MDTKIAVIGLGYVGLPLARLFSTKYKTVGFDMNPNRVKALMDGHDATLEVSDELLQDAINNHGFKCTANIEDIRDCNFYVVAVPTPVDSDNRPDLTPLYSASESVGKVIRKNDIVVYESTVYPGVTEDECIPVIEKVSGLKFNVDFFAGYSPERINPGDKQHTVEHIKKVTSGSTPEIGKKVNEVYASVIKAGTHLAPTMKVAEAAKVIENSQRDINIAFVNELSKIFTLMGIDTNDVLDSYFNVQNLEVFYMLLIFFIICLIIPLLFTITHLVSYKKTYYAYSNKKLLIKSGFIGDDYKVLDIDEVGSLDVVVNFFDKLSNKVETGQINFNSPSSPKGRNGEIQFGFFAIENPYEVYKEIKLVINQAKNKKEN